jgi:hypothetical protein
MQITGKLSELFSKPEVLEFIRSNKDKNPSELALRHAGKVGFSLNPVLDWLDALQRARHKMPLHFAVTCYLTRRAVEQCSSEATAEYKASQIEGKTLLNLCGGIGIDDWALSKKIERIISLDTDVELSNLAKMNFQKLEINNVQRLTLDAADYLDKNITQYDWIFADPDRREQGKRLVTIADCSPDIISLWPQIQAQSNQQLIKLSPLYPIDQLQKELPGLYRIDVLAKDNEVKEVLAFCTSHSINDKVERRAVNLSIQGNVNFLGVPESALCALPSTGGFFYDAHPALAKANLAVSYANHLGIQMLVSNGLYQQSEKLIPGFFGRTFKVINSEMYSGKKFQQYLKKLAINKAHFNCRNFRHNPEELKKLHKIGDGGDDYFFFFDDCLKRACFIHAEKT